MRAIARGRRYACSLGDVILGPRLEHLAFAKIDHAAWYAEQPRIAVPLVDGCGYASIGHRDVAHRACCAL
jgi:hypothetical protein